MVIRIGDIIPSSIDDIMNSYLSCVPNLEYLSIHLAIFDSKTVEFYLDYDWFKTIITDCLLLLQRFRFYIYLTKFSESEIVDMKKRMKENFEIIYNNQYQSRFFIRSI
jgi:hypothetical protein